MSCLCLRKEKIFQVYSGKNWMEGMEMVASSHSDSKQSNWRMKKNYKVQRRYEYEFFLIDL